jgi:hypothetical protein
LEKAPKHQKLDNILAQPVKQIKNKVKKKKRKRKNFYLLFKEKNYVQIEEHKRGKRGVNPKIEIKKKKIKNK